MRCCFFMRGHDLKGAPSNKSATSVFFVFFYAELISVKVTLPKLQCIA